MCESYGSSSEECLDAQADAGDAFGNTQTNANNGTRCF